MSGLNYTARYPHIAEALKWLKLREAVFDGEAVALDASGRPNFQELQNARLTKLPIVYFIFDVLHLSGHDLLDRPLSERRGQLEELAISFADPLRLNPSFQVPLAAFISQVRKLGLEGIVAKRSDSIYIPGKESDSWRKHRFNQEEEFEIGGYIPGGQNFSELVTRAYNPIFVELGIHTKQVNSCGVGLADCRLLIADCFFSKPERRCEVEFVERTKGGRLRHAEFRRLVG
jgi:bifunctional non-homologous end joining protein LigD